MQAFAETLLAQLGACYTLVVVIAGGVAWIASRRADLGSRRRLRPIAVLVILHIAFVLASAASVVFEVRLASTLRIAALAVGGIVVVGIAVFGAFAAMARLGWPAPPIFRDVVAGLALFATLIAVAGYMGIDVTGFVATSAVLTAVIGLALQDTLGNLVAGLVLQSESSVSLGDWVKVGAHVGRVVDMRWRYTAILTRNGETVFVPNGKLVKDDVVRLGRVEGSSTQWRRWIYFNVDFRFAPQDVITTVQSALAAASIKGVSRTPEPTCVLMGFEESYGRFAVRYWLTDLLNDDPTDSLVRTHVYAALKRAAIPMSMPAEARFITKETEHRRTRKAEADVMTMVRALSDIELFRELDATERRELASAMTYAPFAAGETMSRYGATANWLYLITEGQASVRTGTGPHPDAEVARLSAGEFFGEMSLLTGAPREVTVVAVTDVECFRLGRGAFSTLLTRRPEIAERVATLLAERQRALQQAREAVATETTIAPDPDANVILRAIRRFFGLGGEEQTPQ
ncbi:MAG: mechanosensitive ion channel family protein [Deltaproteobacteria bacterium]|jgi:small-conductance mechanosensitive channel